MPLWGSGITDDGDGSENKPQYLSDGEKLNVYATPRGWGQTPANSGNGNPNANPEVLACIGDLNSKGCPETGNIQKTG